MSVTNFASKAVPATAAELRSGDLELSGYAVRWDDFDADGENFLRGSLDVAIPAFLASNALLAFHHDASKVLGRVLEMEPDGKGVRFRARVDKQDAGSPLFHIYDAIRRGSIRQTSLGGYFGRRMTQVGEMIDRVLRITELSVTGAAKHPMTAFSVAEVKALTAAYDAQSDLTMLELRALAAELQIMRAETLIDRR